MDVRSCHEGPQRHPQLSKLAGYSVPAFLALLAIFFLCLPSSAQAAGPPYVISDAGGGDCAQIGVWNAGSKTCTLKQDVSTPTYGIMLTSDSITLDGAGHSLTGGGLYVGVYAASRSNITIKNLKVSGYYFGIEFVATSTSVVLDVTASGCNEGISILASSNSNMLIRNVLKANAGRGIRVADSHSNTIAHGTLMNGTGGGIYLANTNTTTIYGNNFLDNAVGQDVYGPNNNLGVFLTEAEPFGGNYWARHDTAEEGCLNGDNDRYCDSAYSPGLGTDFLPEARRTYYFTWYDQATPGVKDWVLMANPAEGYAVYGWFDLTIAGAAKALPGGAAGLLPGQVSPMGAGVPATLAVTFPGVMNGPVEAGYHSRMKQLASQRVLWGDSLEEVTGIDAGRLSDHYYWTWYDMKSPGFKDWVLVANPSRTETVTAGVVFPDQDQGGAMVSGFADIKPGGVWAATWPGHIGGPVELRAIVKGGSWNSDADRRNVIASQRVLSNNGKAFNEVHGTPAAELSHHYMWTWYDNKSAGAKDWILIANPASSGFSMDYSVFIHGQWAAGGVDLAPGRSAAVQIPNKMDGPVTVETVRHGSGMPLNSIVSQRVIWGPSFEEVPGMPAASLGSLYYWTWYDQASPGVSNWVQVANPDASSLYFEITIAGQSPGGCSKGTLGPGAMISCQFPGQMNGPVKVRAWTNDGKTAGHTVLASQRVLWKGYFNEVMGTALT